MCVLNPLNCKKPLNLLLVVKLICPNHNSPETSCTVAGFEKCYKGMLSVYVLSGLVNLTYIRAAWSSITFPYKLRHKNWYPHSCELAQEQDVSIQ